MPAIMRYISYRLFIAYTRVSLGKLSSSIVSKISIPICLRRNIKSGLDRPIKEEDQYVHLYTPVPPWYTKKKVYDKMKRGYTQPV